MKIWSPFVAVTMAFPSTLFVVKVGGWGVAISRVLKVALPPTWGPEAGAVPVIEKAGGLKHLGNGSAALAHPNATAPLALMSKFGGLAAGDGSAAVAVSPTATRKTGKIRRVQLECMCALSS